MNDLQVSELQKVVRFQHALEARLREVGDIENIGNTDKLCPVKHYFSPGLYAREIFLPKGAVIVGKMHRKPHMVTLVQGKVLVGKDQLEAPLTFCAEPGTKRAVIALEDTIWINYHVVSSQDIDEIEKELIYPEHEVLVMAKMEALS